MVLYRRGTSTTVYRFEIEGAAASVMSDGRGTLVTEEVIDLGTFPTYDRVLLRRRVVPLVPVHLGVLSLSDAGLLFVSCGRCLVRGDLA